MFVADGEAWLPLTRFDPELFHDAYSFFYSYGLDLVLTTPLWCVLSGVPCDGVVIHEQAYSRDVFVEELKQRYLARRAAEAAERARARAVRVMLVCA